MARKSQEETDEVLMRSSTPDPEPETKVEPLVGRQVVILQADGTEMDQNLEVYKVTGKVVVVKAIVPDIRKIMLKGEEFTVDLNILRKADPDSERHGFKVSTLIAAAEIA